MNVCPAYETDALIRRVNIDRFDDREIVRTNLVESFEQLIFYSFCGIFSQDKWLDEKVIILWNG